MIVAFSGKAGSGKSSAASAVEKAVPRTVSIAQSDPMKRFCREVFDFTATQLYGPSESRNTPDSRYRRSGHEPLSPREALQKLGTEWGRSCFEDVWVDYAVRRARFMLATGVDVMDGFGFDDSVDLVLITDVRFPNEMRGIQRAGGKVIRIHRPGCELGGSAGQHQSEIALDSMPDSEFDAVIINDGSLAQLADESIKAVCKWMEARRGPADVRHET